MISLKSSSWSFVPFQSRTCSIYLPMFLFILCFNLLQALYLFLVFKHNFKNVLTKNCMFNINKHIYCFLINALNHTKTLLASYMNKKQHT